MKKQGLYARYIKRVLDIVCALLAMIVFCWLYALVAILVRVKLGRPVIFTQPRPGKDEKIFRLCKFRTMTDARDEHGELLPDDVRLTRFGKILRATSLDELPEAWNILKGDMSVVGPRPQLVRDMVFMTPEQRVRHSVRPGLSGLAQVNGRNAAGWEAKLAYDLAYLEKGITFREDARIVLLTVKKAFVHQEGITEDGLATAEDYGDHLLHLGVVSNEEYQKKQQEALQLIAERNGHSAAGVSA